MSTDGAQPEGALAQADERTMVVGRFEGSFDGESLSIRPVPAEPTEGLLPSAAAPGDGTGVAQEALLGTPPAKKYGSGVVSADPSLVAVEQAAKVLNETTWDTTHCGPVPAKGVCVNVHLRNMFTDDELTRSYFYLSSLIPTKGSTVSVRAIDTATADSGLLGTHGTEVANGLWRYGLVERSTPEARANGRWWVFTGASAGKLTFNFRGEVLATLSRPTVRASLATGTLDAAPYYTSLGTSDTGISTASSLDATSDGTYVTFASSSKILGSTNSSGTKVYRYNLLTGDDAVISLSETKKNIPGGCTSINPSISSDGSKIAFESSGCDLGYGNKNTGTRQVYVRDVTNGHTILVSHSTAGAGTYGGADSYSPRISADGKYVVFLSKATDLIASVPGTANAVNVYRATIDYAGVTASVAHPGTIWPNAESTRPDISGDGRYVVFDTQATNLVASDTVSNSDVYLYDIAAGGTTLSLLSTKSDGTHYANAASGCSMATISQDGSTVGYLCSAAVTGDRIVTSPAATAGRLHAYRRPRANVSQTVMVDQSPTGGEPNQPVPTHGISFSADGTLVGYASAATNLLRTTGCVPGCQSASKREVWVYDSAATDSEVKRSFLVSQVRAPDVAAAPFDASAVDVTATASARMVRMVGTRDNAFVVYLAAASSFTPFTATGPQIYVSPFSDARFQ